MSLMYHASVRSRAGLLCLFLCSLVAGCEKPRERACRALVLQAKNAEDARTAVTPDARMAAHRARSAARWLRMNAVNDAELKKDTEVLADALERLADARFRLATATEVLGATDAADLVARSERLIAYAAAIDTVPSIRTKPCPYYEPQSLIEDPRCMEYVIPSGCVVTGPRLVTVAYQAERCVAALESLIDRAASPSEVKELIENLRATQSWSKTLPARPVEETIAQARAVPTAVADRGRADADITRIVSSLESKCAH